MLDSRNRAPYRELAEECRRLATSAASSQIKNRYLLMAQDYTWLADLKEQAHTGKPATVEENSAWAASMTGRFPAPWRIVEIPQGFAVDDAGGQQLAVFYGLAEPNAARQTDFLTFDEARQMAVDFAKLQKQLGHTWGRSEVATPPEEDRRAKLETSRSPEGALEAWRLPPIPRLPAGAGRPANTPTVGPNAISFEPEEWMSTPLLSRPRDPPYNRTKLLIAIAVAIAGAALPAGYLITRNSDRPVDVVAVPQAATDTLPVESLPLQEAQAPATADTTADTNVGSRVEPKVEAPPRQQAAPLDTKPTERGIEAKPPPTVPEKGSLAAGRDASTCLSSASAVREISPGAWPSWTFRAPGHEGTRCWYASTRSTAHEHR
jgi:hypothetical protein